VLNANDEWCELNGMFLEKNSRSAGVVEYWSIGKAKDSYLAFFIACITPTLHYSIAPVAV
jgi:hypothetical protein